MRFGTYVILMFALCVPGLARAQDGAVNDPPQFIPESELPTTDPQRTTIPSTKKEYGAAKEQTLLLSRVPGKSAPIAVFLQTGDWKSDSGTNLNGLRRSLFRKSIAIVTVNTRSSSKFGIKTSVSDAVAAIAYLRANASEFRIDPNRITIIATGTGAATAALLGCDPAHLASQNIGFAAIRSIILVDGEGIDPIREIEAASGERADDLAMAFGPDTAARTSSSAISQAAAPNAPNFYLLAFEKPETRRDTMETFANALSKSGANTTFDTMSFTSEADFGRRFGTSLHRQSKALIAQIVSSLL